MSNYAPTAASVAKSEAGTYEDLIAGEAITQGDVYYKDTANGGVAKKAQANGTALQATVAGIAQNTVTAAGQPVRGATQDPLFTPGFTLANGAPVFLSATPGKMCPLADLVSTNFCVLLGVGVGSNKMNFKPVIGGAI